MISSSVLQRTFHLLSPWTQHSLQSQSRRHAPINESNILRPTTINLKPVAAQMRFVAQCHRTEQFAHNIVARQIPKTIVNTIRREPQADIHVPPLTSEQLPLAGSRLVSPMAKPASVTQGLSDEIDGQDSWIMRQAMPTTASEGEVVDTDASSYSQARQTDDISHATLTSQRPTLSSVAELIEQRIQRSAAIRRGDVMAEPDLATKEVITSEQVPERKSYSVVSEIQRRVDAASQSHPTSPVNFVDTTPSKQFTGRGIQESSTVEPEQTVHSSEIVSSPPQLQRIPATSVPASSAEIQRRIAEAAQAQLRDSDSAQRQTQAKRGSSSPDATSGRDSLASTSAVSIPPQVRRMRAISQVEEFSSRKQGTSEQLPLAVPATAADFVTTTQPIVQKRSERTEPPHAETSAATRSKREPDAVMIDPAQSQTELSLAAQSAPASPSQTETSQKTLVVQRVPDDRDSDLIRLPESSTEVNDSAVTQSALPQPLPAANAPSKPNNVLSQTAPTVTRSEAESSSSTTLPTIPQAKKQEPPPDPLVSLDTNAEQTRYSAEIAAEPIDTGTKLQPSVQHTQDKAVLQRDKAKMEYASSTQPIDEETVAQNQYTSPIQPEQESADLLQSVKKTSTDVFSSTGEIASQTAPDSTLIELPASRSQKGGTIQRTSEQKMAERSAGILSEQLTQSLPVQVSQAVVSERPNVDAASLADVNQSALEMPLVRPMIQRQSRQLSPAGLDSAVTTNSESAQFRGVLSLTRELHAYRNDPNKATDKQSEKSDRADRADRAVLTGPSIERRVDPGALQSASFVDRGLKTAAPTTIQRQPADTIAPLPQMVDMSATNKDENTQTPVDLDALAREIMPMVKRILSVEREREPYFG